LLLLLRASRAASAAGFPGPGASDLAEVGCSVILSRIKECFA